MTSVTTPLEEIVSGLREKVIEAVEAHWGERCPDFDADCACCQAWAELDAFQAQAARIAELTAERDESARAWRSSFDSMHQRAMAAERDLAAAVEALERINRTTSAGNRTLDEMIRDMGWANDTARATLAKLKGTAK